MKKIGYVIIGLITSVILGSIAVSVILIPIQESTGRSPESLMGYAYLIIYPISLLFGSILTGYLIQPVISEKTFINYLKFSPGLYVSATYLISIVAAPILSVFMVLSAIANIVLSAIGVFSGVKFRENKSNN